MERLTRKTVQKRNGRYHSAGDLTINSAATHREALIRLAAYEDICFDVNGNELIAPSDLAALVKARDEGRLVISPYNVGDTVYFIRPHRTSNIADCIYLPETGVCEGKVLEIGICKMAGRHESFVTISQEKGWLKLESKKVFATKEAAANALREGEK